MSEFRSFEFDEEIHRDIYEFVEQNGAVKPQEVWEAVQIDPEAFRHELALLKRDGYLTERADGRLQVNMHDGSVEEYEESGVAFEIRPAREEDYPEIVGAIRSVTDAQEYIVAESVAEQLHDDDALLRHNKSTSRMFFVGTVENDVVGWVHLCVPQFEKLSNTAQLTLGVLEEYRKYGIGSHLLHRGLEWANSKGFRKVYSSIPATNVDGIQFLLGQGCHLEAVRTDHYAVDGALVDEVMLAYDL